MSAPNPVFLLLKIPDEFNAAMHALPLSASSQARLAQLHAPMRARQFLLGRWLLCNAATRLLGHPVAMTGIDDRGAFPVLAQHPTLHASISHSANRIGVIVNQGARIGLDIEQARRSRNLRALAQRALSAAEIDALRQLDGEALTQAFYRIWTWREAAYKAGLIPQLIGELPLLSAESPTLHTQTGQFDACFWSAVSTQALALMPENVFFPPA